MKDYQDVIFDTEELADESAQTEVVDNDPFEEYEQE